MASVVIKMNPAEYALYIRRLGPAFKAAALRGTQRTALRAVADLQQETSLAPPANPQQVGAGGAVNTGNFKRSWRWSKLPDGAAVYNMAPYAGVIEYGRRPGSQMPPTRPIAQWIQRRLGKNAKEAQGMAFAVAKAIGKRGLLGRKILTRYIPALQGNFRTETLAELNAALGRRTP